MEDEAAIDLGDIQPRADANIYDVEDETSQGSRCYVHTVAFQDVGIVW
jgi:hypothetical protein